MLTFEKVIKNRFVDEKDNPVYLFYDTVLSWVNEHGTFYCYSIDGNDKKYVEEVWYTDKIFNNVHDMIKYFFDDNGPIEKNVQMFEIHYMSDGSPKVKFDLNKNI